MSVKSLSKTNGGLSINGIVISAANPVPSAGGPCGTDQRGYSQHRSRRRDRGFRDVGFEKYSGKEANAIVLGNGVNLGNVFVAGEAEGVLGSVMGVFQTRDLLGFGLEGRFFGQINC